MTEDHRRAGPHKWLHALLALGIAGLVALFPPAFTAAAQDMSALFREGVKALTQAQRAEPEQRDELLDEAIAAFRKMLVVNPGLTRVRLELARAFFLKEEDRLATRHFEMVLAARPPAAVALNVQRFMRIMRARKRWSVRLGAAIAPDTNIGSGSDERTIHIDVLGQRLPFRRDREELTTSGIGLSAWLGGEYQYPLSPRWRIRAGGDLSRREYKGSDFDRLSLAGHVGPRWLVGRGSEASLLLSGAHGWTGSGLGDPSHRDIGFRLEGRLRLSGRTALDARASWHRRSYSERENRDGPLVSLSLGAAWTASPTVRFDGSLGWDRERPETERWRNSSRWAQVGTTIALPWGFTVGGSGALRWTSYEGSWVPFTVDADTPRRDLTRTLRLFAHNRALTLQGFSPQVSVTQALRTSNAQLHDYERVSGELRFVRLF